MNKCVHLYLYHFTFQVLWVLITGNQNVHSRPTVCVIHSLLRAIYSTSRSAKNAAAELINSQAIQLELGSINLLSYITANVQEHWPCLRHGPQYRELSFFGKTQTSLIWTGLSGNSTYVVENTGILIVIRYSIVLSCHLQLRFVICIINEELSWVDRPEQAYQKRQRGYMVIAGRRC